MEKVDHTQVSHIEGRRWFQRSYGNTYHNTILHLKGGGRLESGQQYGYDDQYLQAAFEMMGEKYTGTRGLREDLGITYSVSDVSRQCDL